ncbi:MAG: hypothetical protein DRR19_20985 [Candidatus Parabeggiatoa sp. nov. 1]|nr:MAG: hypothetical protein DRR19_20985 [Gammaproteobacteria bacterium]
MENIINQIRSIRTELQGLLECDVNIRMTNNDTFHWPRVVGETVEIHSKTPINNAAIAIEIAYALQAAVLIRHFPKQRLACYILARQFAFKYLDTFSETERESYKAFLAEYSVNESVLLQAYEALCDEKASPEKKGHCLGTHLIKPHFPDDSANRLNEAVHLAVLAWPLACPTHILLTQGGDDRLHMSYDTGTNKYYIAPFPQSDVIVRSSCTSSPPTVSGFVAAELLRQKLLIAALKKDLSTAFAMSLKNVRNRIASSFKFNESEVFVVCTPSGTDAEMLITYLALCRYKKRGQQQTAKDVPLIQNIIVAAGEVGSGTVEACQCHHFSSSAPDGNRVLIGNCIAGVKDDNVEIVTLPARKKTGVVNDICSSTVQLEEQVRCAIEDNGKTVILHKVERSKTGIKALCLSFLKHLKQKYQDALIIVIDAAQMRCNDSFLSEYLNAGFCVLGTGSKFFSGAPFSGFLLFPTKEAFLSCEEFAGGLGNYFAKDEVDERLTTLKEALPTRRNYGLLLRWETALANIEQYVHIPVDKRASLISQWVKKAQKLLEETAYVNLLNEATLDVEGQITECWQDKTGALEVKSQTEHFRHDGGNTIISFTLHPAQNGEQGEALDTKALKVVYQWMTKDISAWLPIHATIEERFIAKYKCLIGQPVKIGTEPEMGVLRIALSAPMVCRMAEENSLADVSSQITRELGDDRRVLDKLSLIGKYYPLFEKAQNKQ